MTTPPLENQEDDMAGAESEITTGTGDEVDPDKGLAAWTRVEPLLAALGAKRATLRGVDAGLAAIKLVQAGEWLTRGEVTARFAILPGSEFEGRLLALVEPAARSVLHLQAQVKTAAAGTPTVKLDVDLAAAATELRGRMLKVVEYHFGDDPALGAEIEDIRRGKGFRDTADDLLRLSQIYKAKRVVLSQDPTHYRATDETDALRLASRIHEELGAQLDAVLKDLNEKLSRSWTLLVQTWDEVCVAGRCVFSKQPAELGRFASVYSLGRKPAARRPKTETTAPAKKEAEPVD
jgi:hypothetical protein